MGESDKPSALRPISARITGGFWASRLETLVNATLPSQVEQCERTGRIDNFRRAAGKTEKEFQGRYYNDSDVYKLMEALALARHPRATALLDALIPEIAAAQSPDGYINTHFAVDKAAERFTNLKDMHEMYCGGHLIQAGVAHHRATGRTDLLDVGQRFADHLLSLFGPGKREGMCGHQEIELALVALSRETGKTEYLDLAKHFIDTRGRGLIGGSAYHQDHVPFRELTEPAGHAVRMLYYCMGAADVFAETGDVSLMWTLTGLWDEMAGNRMYLTGGLGSRHSGESFGAAYELPNETAYAESCAAVANVMWSHRMLQLTRDAKYAEVMERALFNGALAGISLDGTKYFYVNPLADFAGEHRRQAWFDCACCPPNIARLLASIPDYLASESDDALWLHTYADSTVPFSHGAVEQRTGYPWSGDVELRVLADGEFSLQLRIPEWAEPQLKVNGKEYLAEPGRYAEVHRVWSRGDEVSLSLGMRARLVESHPYVQENIGKVALMRGPLVYCFEGADNAADVRDIVMAGNASFTGLRNSLDVIALRGHAGVVPARDALYRESSRAARPGAVEVTAIPYYAWANREPGQMAVWMRKG